MARGLGGIAGCLDALEALHGPPAKPLPKRPLDWVWWENVAYLVADDRRAEAYRSLSKRVGLTAEAVQRAPREDLLEVARLGGMHPERRARTLAGIADLALEAGGGRLERLLRLPAAEARRILKRFPGIGDPGADKILLFCGIAPVLALESNGLRVAVRLGYGKEGKSYAATYRSAREALEPGLAKDCAELARAHRLLRAHGQTLCRRNAPDCDACPLADACAYAARAG